MRNRLYRSRDDRVIGGVAGGVADYFDLDPSLVRVAWVILALFSGGAFALIYLVMLIVVPEEPLGAYDWELPRPSGTVPPAPSEPGAAGDAGSTVGTAPGFVPSDTTTTGFDSTSPASTRPDWTDTRAERRAARAARRATRRGGPGSGGLVFGLILILLGGYFLLRQFVPQVDIDLAWPVVVIVLGILLLVGALRPGGRPEA
jgi:phage shock protein C